MNTTTLETRRSETTTRSDTLRLPGRTPRTSIVDRLALRIALWLVLWSTRPERDHRATRDAWSGRQRDVARAEREEAWLALARHTHPY